MTLYRVTQGGYTRVQSCVEIEAESESDALQMYEDMEWEEQGWEDDPHYWESADIQIEIAPDRMG